MAENNTAHPSFARWWRQVLFVPLMHSKWLTAAAKARLTAKVTSAERGHRGEVFLIIENHLPIQQAYHIGCRERAIDLFSEYRVWDTEENTGVLVYVNICEHSLEIVADRGISAHVSPTVWRAMCDKAVAGIANQKTEESLLELLDEVGQVLRQYYHLEHDPAGNELSDTVVYLK
ncbi:MULTISPECIES: TPM domain-containing protein [Psychrobacter]|uniref:TPM domain-containing protein n=1 Tax=Psychrobacter TaxID=497 RepID=UPI000CF6B26F|nr:MULTISPECIES: TPM domain-containing protein [unclassified Psychrobacter]MDE0492115.1 TPM domain-containing protein [Psychrobacter sp. A3]